MSWVCIGDYNEILSSSEKQGHRPRHPRFMEEFRSALHHCGLVDIGYHGNTFTWRNGRQGEAFVQERLNRACAIIEWRKLFPQAIVRHLQASYSDHDPILLILQRDTQNGRRKKIPKRCEERWATHLECESIIREAWSRVSYSSSPMFRLFSKIRECRSALVAWSRNMGSFKTRLEEKERVLEELKARNNAGNLDMIQAVKGEINALLYQEELSWRQRSHAIWLPTGDKNTKFFHQRTSQRRRKNHIVGFMDGGGGVTSTEEKERVAEEYFQRLYTITNPNGMEAILDKVDRVVTPVMDQTLLQLYSPDEIKRAFFQMHTSK